ncbi:MAG TPA: FGGY family carbohydrate kinase [Herpetosiphonaceae bacterium]|nr:FGGY family carbohydrate kinase [Herpetosiphonaceae bacterium]
MKQLVGVDVGTTHCKAGLIDGDGSMRVVARRATPTRRSNTGVSFYDPDELWATVAAAMREVVAAAASASIAAVGIASMAETGLLIDRRTGDARTPLLPWFDTAAAPAADRIARAADLRERFLATGQYPSYKSTLSKLLLLRSQDSGITDGATWLSAADYIVYRLTGTMATDYTLAARTYAFGLERRAWDDAWLHEWGLSADLFPQPGPSGAPAGAIAAEQAERVGLAAGTPVAVAGHDHLCAALAAGAVKPGCVFDSIGTAETLIGAVPDRPLGRTEYESGLTYGPHVVPGRLYWMGGLSAAGGSMEWLRGMLDDPPLAYDQFLSLVEAAGPEPTGIIYFPYLLGSGTPHPDALAKGAFVGLSAEHGRPHLAKAVLEGTAYELEFIRRAAEQATGVPIRTLRVAGGGARDDHWVQIKADVGGCRCEVPPLPEAAVLGAAMIAGIGAGLYRDAHEAVRATGQQASAVFVPDDRRHQPYRHLYEHGYLPFQQPLRQFGRTIGRQS